MSDQPRDIVPSRTQRRAARRSGSIALGLVITVMLGASTGVLVAKGDARASAAPAVLAELSTPPFLGDARLRPARPEPSPARIQRRERARAKTCGDPGGRLVSYRVSVQQGLRTTRTRFAEQVARILCDERSWIASGRVRFRYDPHGPTLISLRSAAETERRCMQMIGLSVRMMWSCASRGDGEAVLNADRWFGGSPSWPGSVARYRHMLVNHEVGHLLGHGHKGCGASGRRAPVMMQQSKGTAGCLTNPWPLDRELLATR